MLMSWLWVPLGHGFTSSLQVNNDHEVNVNTNRVKGVTNGKRSVDTCYSLLYGDMFLINMTKFDRQYLMQISNKKFIRNPFSSYGT